MSLSLHLIVIVLRLRHCTTHFHFLFLSRYMLYLYKTYRFESVRQFFLELPHRLNHRHHDYLLLLPDGPVQIRG